MPYDPDDLYTAEPKLLSLDCFPVFFIQPVLPPDYEIVMSGNTTRYHRISDDMNRVSMQSSNAELDAGLLLLDPMASHNNDDGVDPPRKAFRFSCHPTILFRLLAVCLFIPAFVLLIAVERIRNIPAIVFLSLAITRNLLLLLHHVCSDLLRIRIRFSIEFRGRGPVVGKPKRSCPEWLKRGIVHILVDLILFSITLMTSIIAHAASKYNPNDGHWHDDFAVPGYVCSYIGCAFYLFSCIDLGKPSNITISSGISFDYTKKKDERPNTPPSPQVYRDVEAAGGLNVETRKTGADSPVII